MTPSMTAAKPGIGPKQLSARPIRPVIIEAIASPWLGALTGRSGGGGACHTGCTGCGCGCHTGCIGGRSSGATQPPGIGGSRGSHCGFCSERVSTFGSRMAGFQFGSTGGERCSISIVPSSEQNVSQGSVYCRLHCGQYFIWLFASAVASDQFDTTEEVGDFDRRVFVRVGAVRSEERRVGKECRS